MYKICTVIGTPNQNSWAAGLQLADTINFQFPQVILFTIRSYLGHVIQPCYDCFFHPTLENFFLYVTIINLPLALQQAYCAIPLEVMLLLQYLKITNMLLMMCVCVCVCKCSANCFGPCMLSTMLFQLLAILGILSTMLTSAHLSALILSASKKAINPDRKLHFPCRKF